MGWWSRVTEIQVPAPLGDRKEGLRKLEEAFNDDEVKKQAIQKLKNKLLVLYPERRTFRCLYKQVVKLGTSNEPSFYGEFVHDNIATRSTTIRLCNDAKPFLGCFQVKTVVKQKGRNDTFIMHAVSNCHYDFRKDDVDDWRWMEDGSPLEGNVVQILDNLQWQIANGVIEPEFTEYVPL